MAEEGTAAWYRERATELRELAKRSRDPDVRVEQMKMAEQFDRLTRHVEAAQEKRRGAES
jgi:hypothetical protein